MNTLGCDSLNNRRQKLCKNFAEKAKKHPKYKYWFSDFKHKPLNFQTRERKNKTTPEFNPVPTRTERFKKSPLPFLTDLLNAK